MELEAREYTLEEVMEWDDPEEVYPDIYIGDHVIVTSASGREIRGTLAQASDLAIIVTGYGKWLIFRKHVVNIEVDY